MLRQGDKITIMLEQGKLIFYRNGGNHAIQENWGQTPIFSVFLNFLLQNEGRKIGVCPQFSPAVQQPIHIGGPKKSLAGHFEKDQAFQQQPGFCIILIMPDTLQYFRQNNAADTYILPLFQKRRQHMHMFTLFVSKKIYPDSGIDQNIHAKRP